MTQPDDQLLARARARAAMHDPHHPLIVVQLVGGKPGSPDQNFRFAWVEGSKVKFTRGPYEPLENFRQRALDNAPSGTCATCVIFSLREPA